MFPSRLAIVACVGLSACGQQYNPAREAIDAARAAEAKPTEPDAHEGRWTCPMHSDVREAQPGPCRVCGMALVEEEER